MKLKLLVEIAVTMLRARMRQTIVAAAGVTFGITMFVTLLSFMAGLNSLLDGMIINRTPHVRLFRDIQPNAYQPINIDSNYTKSYNFVQSVKASSTRREIYNNAKILNALAQDKRVLGVSRKISTQVFFNVGAVDISGVMNGIDAESEIQYYKFKDYITEGNAIDIAHQANTIILGKPLAEKLNAEVGDVIQATTPQGERFQLRVVGYYQSGFAEFDKVQSFASLATVQKVLGKPKSYLTDIQIKLKDLNMAPAVAKEYAAIFETNAEDIQTANAQFETGSSVRNTISYSVGVVLLIVAGFGIYNILNMMIYEKMDTIAILKATGFSGRDVKLIFLIISMGIGIVGSLVGLLLGGLLSYIISTIPFNTAAIPTIKTYPVSFNPIYYTIATIFSLVTTYFAGWLPARKASKIDPVIIIRGK